jgi:ABC-2 type transport system permease protein
MLLFGLPAYVAAYAVFVKLGYMTIGSIGDFILYILLFLLCAVFAVAINDTINYICGVLCFYTTAAWGLNQTKGVVVSFFSGGLIPLSFFPGNFGKVVEALPFAGLTQNPVYILTQRVDLATAAGLAAKNIAWFLVFELLAKLLFMHASKKVTVQGG